MFESVAAVRFDRRMNIGRTLPCLMTCLRLDEKEVEVVAKFSAGCDIGADGLVAEAVAAMLASDLGLPIPEPAAVKYDGEFIDSVAIVDQSIAERLRKSIPVAFGSIKLPPGFTLPLPNLNTESLRTNAAEIFAFDALIQNPDRRPENPNCLHNGRDFAIFDHELCFITESIIGWRPPWELGSLDLTKHRHIFYSGLSGRNYDLSRLKAAWGIVTDTRLREYRQALPPEWTVNVDRINNMFHYLTEVRDNIDTSMAEIKRVLS